tara:strand:+ start:2118 stop:2975 length:858 start_codon:yes stop_codon:yes gene_type:complete
MKTFLRKEFNKFTVERFPNIYRPDSLPFISGDTFRKFSHHIFDETQSFNPKKVKNNEIIFVNSDLIEIFFKIQDPKIQSQYILISHNSDKSPTKKELSLISENIIHWFVQNLEFSSIDRISYLPIGLENRRWLRNRIKNSHNNIISKSKLILCSLNEYNNYPIRQLVLDIASKNSYVVMKKFTNIEKYFNELGNYKFILCPPGNGPDTHRVWESLIHKTFPIFEINSFTENLRNLGVPAIYLDSWEDLDDYSEKDLELKYEHLLTFELNMIYFEYWKNQITTKFL